MWFIFGSEPNQAGSVICGFTNRLGLRLQNSEPRQSNRSGSQSTQTIGSRWGRPPGSLGSGSTRFDRPVRLDRLRHSSPNGS